ncbi:wax ester/triacylglycerol synthase family O-acyltransferase, partial [bacterium]|nr:wax ester/triacylglycerol synthase family O-acyltransferase [bacterium]
MRRLSPEDILFLLLEKRNQPLHVGALVLLKPPPDAPDDFAAQLAQRLTSFKRAARPFDRRLAERFGLPYWEKDPHFDLAHHFVHLALPKPGRIRELLAMVSRVQSAHLDRKYPLWRIYMVEGLEDGRIALFAKIDHAMVDGVAGGRLWLKSMETDRAASGARPTPWEVLP